MMMNIEHDKLGIDILDDIELVEWDPDFFLQDMDVIGEDDNWLEIECDNLLDFSAVLEPTNNSVTTVTQDIVFDPKDWMVVDKPKGRRRPPRLYEFLVLLLSNSQYITYASYIKKSEGIFLIHEPDKVAKLWEQVKSRQSHQEMTYDKFARAIRWYYKSGIMKKTNARYTFQFSEKTIQDFSICEPGSTDVFSQNVTVKSDAN